MVMTLENKLRFAFSKNHGTRKTTLLTILCVWWVLTWTGAQATVKSTTTQATSSRTTTTPRPNSKSSLKNTPSKPDLPTVTAKLVFNCSFPVPSENLVLNAIATLLNSRFASIPNTVKVLGFYYSKTSGNSYEVFFIISVNAIMPEDYGLRKNIYKQIQTFIDNTLNRLLNEPKAESFESQNASFRNLEIDIEYSFGCGHNKRPVSFLNKLSASETTTTQVEMNNPTTKESTTFTPTPSRNTNIPKAIVIHIKIEFRDLTTVPSKDEVLTTIDAEWNIKKARELGTQIPDNLSIQCISYEKTGSNSYSIDFEFRISNVSIPENMNQLFETYNAIQNTMNLLLSSILNGPNPGQFTYPQVKFSGNSTTIVAFQVYVFNGNDIKAPSELIIQLLIINGHAPTTTATTTTTTVPATISLHQHAPSTTTSAEILTRLVISNSSPLPCESMVISAIQTLLNNQGITFPDNVIVMNYTYEKISDTSYAINITFYMTNIKMHGNDACWEKLEDIKSSVNNAMNKLLNKPGAEPFEEVNFNFSGIGNVYIFITVIFENLTNVPTEAEVVSAANALLESKIRTKRDLDTQILNEPVSIKNITYQKTGSNSYSIDFAFEISDVNVPILLDQRNQTYDLIQYKINSLINGLLKNYTSAGPLQPSTSNFTSSEDKVNGYMVYNIPSMPSQPGNGRHSSNGCYKQHSNADFSRIFTHNINGLLKNYTSAGPLQPSTSNFTSSEDKVNGYMVYNIPSMPSQPGNGRSSEDKVNGYMVYNIPSMPSQPGNGRSTSAQYLQLHVSSHRRLQSSEDKVNGYMVYNIPSMPSQPGNGRHSSNGCYKQHSNADFSRIFTHNVQLMSSEDKVNGYMVYNIPSMPSQPGNGRHSSNGCYKQHSNADFSRIFTHNVQLMSSEDKVNGYMVYNIPSMPSQPGNGRHSSNGCYKQHSNADFSRIFTHNVQLMSSEDKVNGYMVYNIPSMPSQPGNGRSTSAQYLQLHVNGLLKNYTSAGPLQPSTSNFTNGSAVVQTRLVFNSYSPVPSKSEILSAIEEISDTSNAVTITFKVSNISIPTNPDLMNNTYNQVESTINGIVNGLLKNYTSAALLEPSTSNFTNGTVLIYIKLIFQNLIIVPPETLVLNTTIKKLDSKIRRQRDTATQTLEQPVSTHDIIYTKTGNNSFSLDLAFQIANVNLSNRCDTEFNNSTYESIQNEINSLMNTILTKPQTPLFYFPPANFTVFFVDAVQELEDAGAGDNHTMFSIKLITASSKAQNIFIWSSF
ncbi:hypothetical protein Q7C36_007386 [Tachysurus vachellii]|uniref:Uncharacterized protein n=1 Tax=Tachysurus vachellii TaxID=175792 RepID=A0AA88NE35_TACVA|nr:hypothetical protein Q7C36_007386 [Tachysurus vachellii]